jgi:hypothetical protein
MIREHVSGRFKDAALYVDGDRHVDVRGKHALKVVEDFGYMRRVDLEALQLRDFAVTAADLATQATDVTPREEDDNYGHEGDHSQQSSGDRATEEDEKEEGDDEAPADAQKRLGGQRAQPEAHRARSA